MSQRSQVESLVAPGEIEHAGRRATRRAGKPAPEGLGQGAWLRPAERAGSFGEAFLDPQYAAALPHLLEPHARGPRRSRSNSTAAAAAINPLGSHSATGTGTHWARAISWENESSE